jgi:hypothetical protein
MPRFVPVIPDAQSPTADSNFVRLMNNHRMRLLILPFGNVRLNSFTNSVKQLLSKVTGEKLQVVNALAGAYCRSCGWQGRKPEAPLKGPR